MYEYGTGFYHLDGSFRVPLLIRIVRCLWKKITHFSVLTYVGILRKTKSRRFSSSQEKFTVTSEWRQRLQMFQRQMRGVYLSSTRLLTTLLLIPFAHLDTSKFKLSSIFFLKLGNRNSFWHWQNSGKKKKASKYVVKDNKRNIYFSKIHARKFKHHIEFLSHFYRQLKEKVVFYALAVWKLWNWFIPKRKENTE